MDPVVELRDRRLQVRPGETVQTSATVHNATDVIAQYTFEVLGPAAAWAEVVPPTVSVVRNGRNTVQIRFRPPVGPVGSVPFALRCVSQDHPDSAAVDEGELVVGAIHDIVPTVTPTISRGRWTGRWTARFENRGTVAARLRVTASDKRRELGFALAPHEIVVDPGQTGEVYLKARASVPTLLGTVTPRPVQLTYTRATGPDEKADEGTVELVFEQVPVLSRAVAAVGALALVGGAAAVLLLARAAPSDKLASDKVSRPDQPTGLTAEPAGAGAISLNWSAVPSAENYLLYKLVGADADGAANELHPVKAPLTAHTWEGLAAGAHTCFRLVASNEGGESKASEMVCQDAGASPATPEPTGSSTPPTTPTPDPNVTGTTPTDPGGKTGQGREPQGFYVVLGSFWKEDKQEQDAQKPLLRKTEIDRALGVTTVLADADASKRLGSQFPGQVIIYLDGQFASWAEADAYCTEKKASGLLGRDPVCFAPLEAGSATVRPVPSPTPAGNGPPSGTPSARPTSLVLGR
ncbi:hypothetical protein CcI49_26585 [Frankia sp. CcI49]|uniref:fibronectin type III domain-containing protein n=1 Tax=Frankia sp. R43 TaxID=269536 RepID=UPI0006CA3EAD|nr:fibronectin type III domain-containing protein [Frankia sp. R43]KPM56719.1 fibronectin [Frankia sp. R43]ONH57001.1 hypothetical protein CcI49_26585 [Frankia sp. CcI49]